MGQLFSIIVVAIILLSMNSRLAMVNLVIMPLLAAITRYYQKPLREAARSIRAKVGDLTAVASEAISNIQVVGAFANERLETERFRQENQNYVDLNLSRRKDVGLMEGLISIVADYGLALITVVGGWFIVKGQLSLGELTAFLMYQRMLQGASDVDYVL
ncbi:MAG: ABC transporter ATP-binding protein [Deinococcales bacterium]